MGKKKKKKEEVVPRFVNMQNNKVCVHDINGRHQIVNPFSLEDSGRDGLYVVEGEHYRKFVSGKGPLYPFPEEAKTVPQPTPESGDTLVTEADGDPDGDGISEDVPAPDGDDAPADDPEEGEDDEVNEDGEEPVEDPPVATAPVKKKAKKKAKKTRLGRRG